MLALTLLGNTRMEEMLNSNNITVDKATKTLQLNESFFDKIKAKPNYATAFEKGGIDLTIFNEAVSFFFREIAPANVASDQRFSANRSPYDGYKNLQARVKKNPALRGRSVIDVVLNSNYTYLQNVDTVPVNPEASAKILEKRRQGLGVPGFEVTEDNLN